MTKPYYKKNSHNLWWCVVHRRRATHLLVREGMEDEPCCAPNLGGITMPCITRIKLKGCLDGQESKHLDGAPPVAPNEPGPDEKIPTAELGS